MTGEIDQFLSGTSAFAAVMTQWRTGATPAARIVDPPYARLSFALLDPEASDADKHVLLRNALRYESLRTGRMVNEVLPRLSGSLTRLVSLDLIPATSDTAQITATAWRPNWIRTGNSAVDDGAMRAESCRFTEGTAIPGDPWLSKASLQTYRSVGQRNAVRAAISMPPGAFLIVDLPTGEGKSLVFRLLAEVGFASTPYGVAPGLVIVVVPTVTLALDHERSWGKAANAALAYVGGREESNARIREAIVNGTQRVVFASPEAVVTSLRRPLEQAARSGQIGAVVVDEAHLIDGWGTGFRTEFQTLAGALNNWRSHCPAEAVFRTLFLSATLDGGSIETIEDLFSPQKPIPIISGASIRPEPEYWIARPSDSDTRIARVEEALWHLPRPLILYVTKVADAEFWNQRLRELGFQRYAMVHGGTVGHTREKVLQAWSEARIDLVVATSAFGLGIDYPHVRSVVHACLPETMDRFYQEVGRGGRDGCVSVSLVIPDAIDREVAKSLSQKKVITVERGLKRWEAMFNDSAARAHGRFMYSVPIDVAPGPEIEDIDLLGELSTDWNQRVLALMARAGLIRLLGAETTDPGNTSGPCKFELIEILVDRPSDREVWETNVEAVRRQIMEHAWRSFSLFEDYVRDEECPARMLANLYSRPDTSVALQCTSCARCRKDPGARSPQGTVAPRASPWGMDAPLGERLVDSVAPYGQILVTYPLSVPARGEVREVEELVRRLDQFGLRNLVVVGEVPSWLLGRTESAIVGRPWTKTVADRWAPLTWPKGSRLVICNDSVAPDPKRLSVDKQLKLQVLLMPDGSRDPTHPEREFASVFPGRTTTLKAFIADNLQ